LILYTSLETETSPKVAEQFRDRAVLKVETVVAGLGPSNPSLEQLRSLANLLRILCESLSVYAESCLYRRARRKDFRVRSTWVTSHKTAHSTQPATVD
jgi:hypothetical protein